MGPVLSITSPKPHKIIKIEICVPLKHFVPPFYGSSKVLLALKYLILKV